MKYKLPTLKNKQKRILFVSVKISTEIGKVYTYLTGNVLVKPNSVS